MIRRRAVRPLISPPVTGGLQRSHVRRSRNARDDRKSRCRISLHYAGAGRGSYLMPGGIVLLFGSILIPRFWSWATISCAPLLPCPASLATSAAIESISALVFTDCWKADSWLTLSRSRLVRSETNCVV